MAPRKVDTLYIFARYPKIDINFVKYRKKWDQSEGRELSLSAKVCWRDEAGAQTQFYLSRLCNSLSCSLSSLPSSDAKEVEIEKKNMFGLLFTLKTFVNSITPRNLDEQEKEPIRYFQTAQYQ
eukprot:709495-Amorphochlora_amoeboformis.AAC.1